MIFKLQISRRDFKRGFYHDRDQVIPGYSLKVSMESYLEDIYDEPDELTKSIAHQFAEGQSAINEAASTIDNSSDIIVTGMGSSFCVGLAFKSFLSKYGRPIRLIETSELIHFTRVLEGSTVVAVSRSGSSAEITGMIDMLGDRDVRIVAVTNSPESPLGRRADVVCDARVAFDHNISIATYTALLSTSLVLASDVCGRWEESLEGQLIRSIESCETLIGVWKDQLEGLGSFFAENGSYFFLGRGLNIASSYEGALLWEEAAKFPASAMPTGSFRHGPQEVIGPDFRAFIWLDQLSMREADLALARDISKLSGEFVLIGQGLEQIKSPSAFALPKIDPDFESVISIIPAQIAAYVFAMNRNQDPDSFKYSKYIVEDEGGIL